MSGSVNKVTIIGNLGKDPEVRQTGEGKPVANITVATNERWKDRDGNPQERTEWHRLVLFGGLADVAQKYLKKGDTAYFEGRLQTRKWTDNQGQDKYTTEIVVDQGGSMQMLGSRNSSGGGSYDSAPQDNYDQTAKAPAMAPAKAASNDAPFDDDIPF